MNRILLTVLVAVLAGCGAPEIGTTELDVAWSFNNGGSCAENMVTTVTVVATPDSGAPLEGEYPCEDGQGPLGELTGDPVTYSVEAEGLDADGVVRAVTFGQSSSFPDGRAIGPLDVTLFPKPSNVVVSWSVGGSACPPGVVIPYMVRLYDVPADGEELGDPVEEVQETCSAGMATITNVDAGDYIAEVDSISQQPKVQGTEPVTVLVGEDAMVSIEIP